MVNDLSHEATLQTDSFPRVAEDRESRDLSASIRAFAAAILADSLASRAFFLRLSTVNTNGKRFSGLRRRPRKNPIAQVPRRSHPAGELRITGIEFTATLTRRNNLRASARNHERNIRMPRQRNCVRGIFRANVHSVPCKSIPCRPTSARIWCKPRRLSARPSKIPSSLFRCHFRFNRSVISSTPIPNYPDHRHRFRQTNVLDSSFFRARAKFLHAQSRPIFFCSGQSPLRRVHNRSAFACRFAATLPQRNRQLVITNPGFTPSRPAPRPTLSPPDPASRKVPDASGTDTKFLAVETTHTLLPGTPATGPSLSAAKKKSCASLRPPLSQPSALRRDFHAPRRRRSRPPLRPNRVHFCRVVTIAPIISTDCFSRISFAIEAPIGQCILNRAYFLFHYRSPLRRCKPTRAC